MGVMLYDADKIKDLASTPNEGDLYEAQRQIFLDPNDPEIEAAALEAGISHDWIEAAKASPIYKMIPNGRSHFRCTRNSERCRWFGTSRRFLRLRRQLT